MSTVSTEIIELALAINQAVPGVNDLYKNVVIPIPGTKRCGVRRALTKKAERVRNEVKALISQQYLVEIQKFMQTFQERLAAHDTPWLEVDITASFPLYNKGYPKEAKTPWKRRDVDGPVKFLLDVITEAIGLNGDEMVRRLAIEKVDGPEDHYFVTLSIRR